MKPSDILLPLCCGLMIGCVSPEPSGGPVKASASARAIGDDDAFWDNLWSDVEGAEGDPTMQREIVEAPSGAPDVGGAAFAPVAAGVAPTSAPTGIDPVEIAPGVYLPSRYPDALNALRSTGHEILSAEQGVGITAEKVERLKGEEAVAYLLGKGVEQADPAVSGRPAEAREVTITTRRAFQYPDGVFNGGHRFESRYEWR
jgi:hypothetical protein